METRDLEVNSFQELSDQVKDLPRKARSRLVFRGQVRDYGSMCPSVFRLTSVRSDLVPVYDRWGNLIGRHTKATLLRKFVDWFLSYKLPQWHTEYYGYIGYDHRNIEDKRRDFYALLQHYGAPTKYLDVTYDLRIALWFAIHQQRPLDERRVTYEVTDTGENAIYVFLPRRHVQHIQANTNEIVAVSLERSTEKFAWYRPQRILKQKAALLQGASRKAPDLTPHILARIRLTRKSFRGSWLKEFIRDVPLHMVFPHWEEADYFYGYLLDCNDMWLGMIPEIVYPDKPPYREPHIWPH